MFSLAFLAGLLTTVFSGSGRFLKILLILLTGIFLIVSIAGFYFTSGWLIFLYTQLIVLWLIIYGVTAASFITKHGGNDMLKWSISFLIIAIIAGLFGLGGVASTATSLAKITFLIFLALFLVTIISQGVRRFRL